MLGQIPKESSKLRKAPTDGVSFSEVLGGASDPVQEWLRAGRAIQAVSYGMKV